MQKKKLPKLPIGIQTFSEIREENYVYIDKTGIAADLIERYKYVFLARPRRFGKSLFLDTLKELFEGNRQLFTGLVAENLHDWSQQFPVINISFGRGDFHTIAEIKESIIRNIVINEEKFDIPQAGKNYSPAIRFDELIAAVAKKYGQKVVVLIDEYDKPILDNLANREVAEDARAILRAFYTVLKGNDALIRFAFLTGVSKFSKVSTFSGLNNLEDISLNSQFGAICGYTQAEVETSFAEYLQDIDRSTLKQWYDGYNFLGENVYNPFDILLFLKNGGEFRSYWFETGTPNMLVEMIKKERYFLPNLARITAGDELLTSFDIDNIDLITMLFQTGYLTINKIERIGILREYTLGFPNLEVEAGLNSALLSLFIPSQKKFCLQMDGYKALLTGELERFHKALKALFAAIPYHNYSPNELAKYEGFYASVIYAWLASSHLGVIVEDGTNQGRIDMVIEAGEYIYIVEFKVDDTGANAIAQIQEKGYAQKYSAANKRIILIGISFNSKEKNISEFLWEEL